MPATSFADAPATRLLKSNYSGVYGRLVELPWTQDSITDTEHDAIEWLYWLSSRNWQAAVALLDLPWVQDSITETEADAIEWVYWLAEEDRRAVAEVIAKPFLKTLEADDVQTIREMTGRNSESYLGQIERWYPAVAEPLRGLSWPQPPYTETEIDAIEWLYQMAREDEESAATIAAMPWVQDGMTHTEREAIKRIYYLMRESKDLAAKVIALPWVQDDITDTERNTIRQIDNVLEKDDEYGEAFIETIVGLPWIQDGITETEGEFVDIFEGLDDQSEKAAATVIAMPWVQDGITETEAEALKYLNWISGRNADAAAALIAMPFLESVEIRDTLALRSLNHISGKDASDFRELMSYPRIKDGITDEDTKIVAVLGGRTYSDAPGAAEILLAETGAYIQERLIVLPHSGETLLAVIRTQDKVTPSMDYLEHAVRTIERFMGAPFPIYYLALLYYDGERIGANNNFTHLLINAEDDVVDGPEWQGTPSLIAHETAHWYWYRSTSSNPYKNGFRRAVLTSFA